ARAAVATVLAAEPDRESSPPGEFAVLNGVFWLPGNMCQDGPVALALDDLHWAGEGSLRFVAFLLPRREDIPVLLVAGMRVGEPGAADMPLDVIAMDPACRVLSPAPLSAEATTRLLAEVFGCEPE